MSRARTDMREAKFFEQVSHRGHCEPDPVALLDNGLDVGTAPARHTVAFRSRPVLHRLCKRLPRSWRSLARASGWRRILAPVRALGLKGVHPITQRLCLHGVLAGGLISAHAVVNTGQCQ